MDLTCLKSFVFICSSIKHTELYLNLPGLQYFAITSVNNFRLINADPKTVIIKDF